jgi:hypothetical protein
VLEQLNGFYAGQQVQLASDSLVTKFLATPACGATTNRRS